MPWVPFVDDKLKKEIDKLGDSEDSGKITFPESSFLSSCLRIGLTLNDLKKLTYVEVMKTMISYLDLKKDDKKKKSNVREATQADIDRFLGG